MADRRFTGHWLPKETTVVLIIIPSCVVLERRRTLSHEIAGISQESNDLEQQKIKFSVFGSRPINKLQGFQWTTSRQLNGSLFESY